ncbi:MAG: 4Fe-4S binding protein, partial [Duncaniella sp.]|nr:4Fe-4S binding protein [Duncaniella sp.]
NGTITLHGKTVETWDGKKKKKLDKYIYDLGSCTFCQLCVVNCPTDALDFSNDFEQSVFTRSKLVKQLNYLPEKPEPEPTPEQRAKFEAEKAAKAEAAKAVTAQQTEEYDFPIDENGRKALERLANDPEKKAKLIAVLRAKALKANGQD